MPAGKGEKAQSPQGSPPHKKDKEASSAEKAPEPPAEQPASKLDPKQVLKLLKAKDKEGKLEGLEQCASELSILRNGPILAIVIAFIAKPKAVDTMLPALKLMLSFLTSQGTPYQGVKPSAHALLDLDAMKTDKEKEALRTFPQTVLGLLNNKDKDVQEMAIKCFEEAMAYVATLPPSDLSNSLSIFLGSEGSNLLLIAKKLEDKKPQGDGLVCSLIHCLAMLLQNKEPDALPNSTSLATERLISCLWTHSSKENIPEAKPHALSALACLLQNGGPPVLELFLKVVELSHIRKFVGDELSAMKALSTALSPDVTHAKEKKSSHLTVDTDKTPKVVERAVSMRPLCLILFKLCQHLNNTSQTEEVKEDIRSLLLDFYLALFSSSDLLASEELALTLCKTLTTICEADASFRLALCEKNLLGSLLTALTASSLREANSVKYALDKLVHHLLPDAGEQVDEAITLPRAQGARAFIEVPAILAMMKDSQEFDLLLCVRLVAVLSQRQKDAEAMAFALYQPLVSRLEQQVAALAHRTSSESLEGEPLRAISIAFAIVRGITNLARFASKIVQENHQDTRVAVNSLIGLLRWLSPNNGTGSVASLPLDPCRCSWQDKQDLKETVNMEVEIAAALATIAESCSNLSQGTEGQEVQVKDDGASALRERTGDLLALLAESKQPSVRLLFMKIIPPVYGTIDGKLALAQAAAVPKPEAGGLATTAEQQRRYFGTNLESDSAQLYLCLLRPILSVLESSSSQEDILISVRALFALCHDLAPDGSPPETSPSQFANFFAGYAMRLGALVHLISLLASSGELLGTAETKDEMEKAMDLLAHNLIARGETLQIAMKKTLEAYAQSPPEPIPAKGKDGSKPNAARPNSAAKPSSGGPKGKDKEKDKKESHATDNLNAGLPYDSSALSPADVVNVKKEWEDLLNNRVDNKRYDFGGYTALIAAISGGLTEIVYSLLRSEADPNITDDEGNSPLMHALSNGMIEIIGALVSTGALVDHANNHGDTVLKFALATPTVTILKELEAKRQEERPQEIHEVGPLALSLLLEEDADPEISDNEGNFLIHLLLLGAQVQGRVRLSRLRLCYSSRDAQNAEQVAFYLQEILKRKPDINVCNLQGQTALHIAIRKGHLAAARILLEAGCNPNVRDQNGLLPLHYASAGACPDSVSLIKELLRVGVRWPIIDGAHVDKHKGRSAAYKQRLAVTEILDFGLASLLSPAVVVQPAATLEDLTTSQGKDGKDLFLSAGGALDDQLQFYLQSDAAVDSLMPNERSKVLAFLLNELKLQPTKRMADGRNILHVACMMAGPRAVDVSLMSTIAKAWPSLLTQTVDGRKDLSLDRRLLLTPLHIALRQGEATFLTLVGENFSALLLDTFPSLLHEAIGVEVSRATLHALATPEAISKAAEVAEMSVEAYSGYLMTRAAWLRKAEHLESFLDLRIFSVDARHPVNGQTALHVTCESREEGLTSLLLDRGARIDIEDQDGMTPLKLAFDLGFQNFFRLLLERKKDLPLDTISMVVREAEQRSISLGQRQKDEPMTEQLALEGPEAIMRLVLKLAEDLPVQHVHPCFAAGLTYSEHLKREESGSATGLLEGKDPCLVPVDALRAPESPAGALGTAGQ